MKKFDQLNTQMRPTQVAKRIKALRESLGLNRVEFSDRVGIDPSSYTKIEKGIKPLKIEMGFAISETYGVPLDFIYRGQTHQLPVSLANKIANFME